MAISRKLLHTAVAISCGFFVKSGVAQERAMPTRTASAAQQPGGHANDPIGVVMQNNGGSLLRAEVAGAPRPDPLIFNSSNGADATSSGKASEAGSAASISFFAVPPPDAKRLKKHDLVTIVVHEEGAFSTASTTDLKKQADIDAQLDNFIAFRLVHPSLRGIVPGGAQGVPEIKAQGSGDYKGEGSVDRTESLTERITAEILDIKPNGTVVLQAVKRNKNDEEEQRMILTGTCRADDISADNTVLSSQLYGLDLENKHSGAVADNNNRGILTRIMQTINPF